MPSAQKFFDYAEQKNRAVHNWGSHVFKVFLTNTAPAQSNTMLSEITQIAATGGYAPATLTFNPAMTESGGTVTVSANQVVFTASGAAMAPFRYYGIYNDTATSPADALVMFWDHGSSVTLNDGDSFTIKFSNASPGVVFTDS
jgi:hypothetical protein